MKFSLDAGLRKLQKSRPVRKKGRCEAAFFGNCKCKMLFLQYICSSIFGSGCSSARLEYTSGGRVVASSNLVIPTSIVDNQLLTNKFVQIADKNE